MKNLKYAVLALALILGFSHNAFAKHHDRPYGMAGCGLWSMVLKDKDQGSQLGVWALRTFLLHVQTFAITSGTSNCVHGAKSAAKEKEIYVAMNLSDLTKEAAQGEGEHLNGLATVLGCNDSAQFAKMSQKQYQNIFGSDDPKVVLDNYLNEVRSDDQLSQNCVVTS